MGGAAMGGAQVPFAVCRTPWIKSYFPTCTAPPSDVPYRWSRASRQTGLRRAEAAMAAQAGPCGAAPSCDRVTLRRDAFADLAAHQLVATRCLC